MNLPRESVFETPIIYVVRFYDYSDSRVSMKVKKFENKCAKNELLHHLKPLGAKYYTKEGFKRYITLYYMEEYYEIPFSSFSELDDEIYQDYYEKAEMVMLSAERLCHRIQSMNVEECIKLNEN